MSNVDFGLFSVCFSFRLKNIQKDISQFSTVVFYFSGINENHLNLMLQI